MRMKAAPTTTTKQLPIVSRIKWVELCVWMWNYHKAAWETFHSTSFRCRLERFSSELFPLLALPLKARRCSSCGRCFSIFFLTFDSRWPSPNKQSRLSRHFKQFCVPFCCCILRKFFHFCFSDKSGCWCMRNEILLLLLTRIGLVKGKAKGKARHWD